MKTAQIGAPISSFHHGPSIFARAWQGFISFSEAYAERASRRSQVTALQAKSDAELARLGIKRSEIVLHVFRDRFIA